MSLQVSHLQPVNITDVKRAVFYPHDKEPSRLPLLLLHTHWFAACMQHTADDSRPLTGCQLRPVQRSVCTERGSLYSKNNVPLYLVVSVNKETKMVFGKRQLPMFQY